MLSPTGFANQIEMARKGQSYNITAICDYLANAVYQYRTYGDIEEGVYKSKLADAIMTALPVICTHIMEQEKRQAEYIAAYSAANNRKMEADKRFKMWQGVALGISSFTILYALGRAILWLWPMWPVIINWLDSRL